MNRTELIILTAVALFAAFALGWLAAWAFNRMRTVTTEDIAELDQMASSLHAIEEERDTLQAQFAKREAELSNRLGQTEAELSAAMEGLGVARREAEELRAYIEEHSQG